jgi:ATP-dependent DNA ligase
MRRSAAKSTSLTFVEPMKALSVPDLPTGRWIYEMKFDGYL